MAPFIIILKEPMFDLQLEASRAMEPKKANRYIIEDSKCLLPEAQRVCICLAKSCFWVAADNNCATNY